MDDAIAIVERRLEELRDAYQKSPAMWLVHRLIEAEYIWYILKHRPEKVMEVQK